MPLGGFSQNWSPPIQPEKDNSELEKKIEDSVSLEICYMEALKQEIRNLNNILSRMIND